MKPAKRINRELSETKIFNLALEIGGTKLQAALGTHDGEILSRERGAAPASDGPDPTPTLADTAARGSDC